ncbi:MAG TPA: gluconeogenesis factor YvcK family protein [Candidatus Limnocylindrales bacterium]|nr:gluconeogenesis factor YvcK family protein [Candidatus Limnocylindrales bacterium]
MGRWARWSRWLRPGVGLKRWLLVIFVGELLVAFAGALVLRQVYRAVAPEGPGQSTLLWLLTLQFLPLELRPVVLAGVGLLVFLVGLRRLVAVALEPFGQRREPLVELIYQKRSLARGPRIVAVGGGTGLSVLLRGLKEHTSNITAVVAVADDGGSSGRLRDELGIAPVGDLRNCIAALADAEPEMARLLQYRFPAGGEGRETVRGHAFGNLLLAALSQIEGDFEEGVRQANRVLAVRGRVVPAAPLPLTLHAELADGSLLAGQSRIARAAGIRRVWIEPADAHATAEALEAVATADLVVLGPGSLYTSLLPSLLIPELRQALSVCRAPRVYVANVATQVGETQGYTLAEHLAALEAHGLAGAVDAILANDERVMPLSLRAVVRAPADPLPVRVDLPRDPAARPRLVVLDVVDRQDPHHHDPALLADALLATLEAWPAAPLPSPAARSA